MVKLITFAPIVALAGYALAQCPALSGLPLQLQGNINDIKTNVDKTDAEVSTFVRSKGLTYALTIQTLEQGIERAVNAAVATANGITSATACDGQALVQVLGAATPSITRLLSDIVTKQQEFTAVGVSSIIIGDLGNLQRATHRLEQQVYAKLDCGSVRSLQYYLTQINQGFSNALAAYGAPSEAAPVSPC